MLRKLARIVYSCAAQVHGVETVTIGSDPGSCKEAVNTTPFASKWIGGIREELESFIENET